MLDQASEHYEQLLLVSSYRFHHPMALLPEALKIFHLTKKVKRVRTNQTSARSQDALYTFLAQSQANHIKVTNSKTLR